MPIAYVMRGIPGSGKTTWLRLNAGYVAVFSADDYHTKDGVYAFDPKNIKTAHDWCLKGFIANVTNQAFFSASKQDVAVSNTNVRVWELSPYVRIAEAFGFEVRIMRMVCRPEVAITRGVHGVPPEQVWKMHTEMESLPPHWRETPIFTDA